MSDPVVLALVGGAAIGLLLGLTGMVFHLSKELDKLRSKDRGILRLDGNALHGRIVFVDDIGWAREIARWGLDSNGNLAFDWHSDHTLFSGYMIEGPDDVPDELRTDPEAPYGRSRMHRGAPH